MDAKGQAAVETLWLVPVAAALMSGICLFGVGLVSNSVANAAAEAAAVAAIEHGDIKAAARQAAPGWAGEGMRVEVTDGRVSVRVVPSGLVGPLAPLVGACSQIAFGDGN